MPHKGYLKTAKHSSNRRATTINYIIENGSHFYYYLRTASSR